jgi:hypothetical protein
MIVEPPPNAAQKFSVLDRIALNVLKQGNAPKNVASTKSA